MREEVLRFYKYTPTEKPIYRDKFCAVPFDTIQIDNDGDVLLCGCTGHMPYVLGNIFENSLKEIWLNDKANQVRQAVINGKFTYCSWNCSNLSNLPDRKNIIIPEVADFPSKIKLDFDRSCNLKCPSCRETIIIEKQSTKISKQIKIFEEIKQWALDHPNQTISISPISSGEVFASHSGLAFLESLREFPNRNLKVFLMTNGTLIEKNKDLINDIRHLIKYCSISIDAATAETYKQVRGGNWTILLQGLEFLKSLEKQMQFNFVVQKNNWHEIIDFANFASTYNASIFYNNLENFGHWTVQWWRDNNVLDRTNKNYHLLLESLLQVSRKYPEQVKFSADITNNLRKIEHN